MNRFLRRKIWRRLSELPDDSAYAVLDLIDELEAEQRAAADEASGAFQVFGERVEDGLRRRRIPEAARRGTLKILGATDRLLGIVRETGREFLAELERGRPEPGPGGDEEPPRERRVVHR